MCLGMSTATYIQCLNVSMYSVSLKKQGLSVLDHITFKDIKLFGVGLQLY